MPTSMWQAVPTTRLTIFLEDKVDMQLHYFNEEYPKTIHQQFIGYAPAVVVVPEELGIHDIEKACELKFHFA